MLRYFETLLGRVPDDVPVVANNVAWRTAAVKAREGQLTAMRDLAGKWATSLALLTTVTAIGGLKVSPEALGMTFPFWHNLGLWLLAGIVLLFTVATIFAVWAAQGHPLQTTDDADEYAAYNGTVIGAIVARLTISRVLSFICLLLILAFAGIVLLTPADPAFHEWNRKALTEPEVTKPYSVVRTSAGPVYCGKLTYNEKGIGVLAPTALKSPAVELSGVMDIQKVANCNK